MNRTQRVCQRAPDKLLWEILYYNPEGRCENQQIKS